MTNLILGGGLAGLATSYHASHAGCEVIERGAQLGGHATSIRRGGFTWDEGPHVSFTKQPYVRELFEELIGGALEEQVARVGNYDSGDWIEVVFRSRVEQLPQTVIGLENIGYFVFRQTVDRAIGVIVPGHRLVAQIMISRKVDALALRVVINFLEDKVDRRSAFLLGCR